MGREPPTLPEEEKITRMKESNETGTSGQTSSGSSSEPSEEENAMWEDDDARTFYTVLPDFRERVPPILLGIKTTQQTSDNPSNATNTSNTSNATANATTNTANTSTTSTVTNTSSTSSTANSESESAKEQTPSAPETHSAPSEQLAAFMQRLEKSVNRDLIDQAALDYLYINNKANRTKLVKHLFNVPRTRLDLLRYYARFVAIISQYFKDFGRDLVQKVRFFLFSFIFSE